MQVITPNKAMKQTSLTVTFFACAKNSPASVGRLSWCYAAHFRAGLERQNG